MFHQDSLKWREIVYQKDSKEEFLPKKVFEEEPLPKNKKESTFTKATQEKFLQTPPQRNLYPQHLFQKGPSQFFSREISTQKISREISTKK